MAPLESPSSRETSAPSFSAFPDYDERTDTFYSYFDAPEAVKQEWVKGVCDTIQHSLATSTGESWRQDLKAVLKTVESESGLLDAGERLDMITEVMTELISRKKP